MTILSDENKNTVNSIIMRLNALKTFFTTNNHDCNNIEVLLNTLQSSTGILTNQSTLLQHKLDAINKIEESTANLGKQVRELLPKAAAHWDNILFNVITTLTTELRLKLAPATMQFNRQIQLHKAMQYSSNNFEQKEKSSTSNTATKSTNSSIAPSNSSPISTSTYTSSTLIQQHSPIISNTDSQNNERQPLLSAHQQDASQSSTPTDDQVRRKKPGCCVII